IHWQHNRYRREALAELRDVESSLKDPRTRPAELLLLCELLKRTALTAFPRERVASLNGKAWVEFLDHTGGQTAFGNGPRTLLETTLYDPRTAATLDNHSVQALSAAIRQWVKKHRNKTERDDEKGGKARPADPPSPPLWVSGEKA